MICLDTQINYAGLLKEKGNSAWNIRYVDLFYFAIHIDFVHVNNSFFFQHHMPVLPNVQKELEDEYRKTLPAAKK